MSGFDAIVNEEIGQWLAAAREDLGMSQPQLGDALDVSRNTIARWERGERRVSAPAMLRLAIEALASRAATEQQRQRLGR